MASVTQRIKQITQPYGGYLPAKLFDKTYLQDDYVLYEEENIAASLIGLAVDYLTRFKLGETAKKAFSISLNGALLINMYDKALSLVNKINGLDDISIISACKLCGFDVCFRQSLNAYTPIEEIEPDKKTIYNIKVMVERSLKFFSEYGPVICSEPVFDGGYTSTVHSGDGDFVTIDTLWDFKVSKNHITSKHTLQILMYYIMGQHSIYKYFNNIKYLGFYNPRLNIVYLYPVNNISPEIINIIEKEVICYDKTISKYDSAMKRKIENNNSTLKNNRFSSQSEYDKNVEQLEKNILIIGIIGVVIFIIIIIAVLSLIASILLE